MTCMRCAGLMMRQAYMTTDGPWRGLVCVNYGNLIDPIAQRQRTSPTEPRVVYHPVYRKHRLVRDR